MKQFFEIFRAGNYPQGNFDEKDIAALAENYDPSWLEAPITLDHGWGGPAYGWIEQLKADGKRLLATFKDVSDEMTAMTANKSYKRHSVEIYNDLNGKGPYLKALSMLGANAPQVKGMQPIEFSSFSENFPDDESAEIELGHPIKAEAEDHNEESATHDELAKKLGYDSFKEMSETVSNYQERLDNLSEELEAAKEATGNYKDENEQIKFEQRQSDFKNFIDEQTEAGKLPPKLKGQAVDMFGHLDGIEAEDDEKTPLALFKEFITGLPEFDFEEQAKKDEQPEDDNTPAVVAKKARKYRQELKKQGRTISFEKAVNHVNKQ